MQLLHADFSGLGLLHGCFGGLAEPPKRLVFHSDRRRQLSGSDEGGSAPWPDLNFSFSFLCLSRGYLDALILSLSHTLSTRTHAKQVTSLFLYFYYFLLCRSGVSNPFPSKSYCYKIKIDTTFSNLETFVLVFYFDTSSKDLKKILVFTV